MYLSRMSRRLLNRETKRNYPESPQQQQQLVTSTKANPHFVPAPAIDVIGAIDDIDNVKKSKSKQNFKSLFMLRKMNQRHFVMIVFFLLLVLFRTFYGTISIHKARKQQQQQGTLTYNHVECGGRNHGEFTIPHRLIFTYKNNMLETKEPAALYENVLNTIDIYSTLWKQSKSEIDVMFLDDQACLDVIHTVAPTRLIEPFLYESHGEYAADICRVAALYCHGGYYFDVDIQVLKPLDPEPHIDFITAKEASIHGSEPGFFQAVLATSPQHQILKYAFDSMVNDWYFNPAMAERLQLNEKFNPHRFYRDRNMKFLRSIIGKGWMGTLTLKKGYQRYDNRDTSWLLQEVDNSEHNSPVKYNDLYRSHAGWLCNFIVEDPSTSTPYFYSRIRGVPHCA